MRDKFGDLPSKIGIVDVEQYKRLLLKKFEEMYRICSEIDELRRTLDYITEHQEELSQVRTREELVKLLGR